MEMDLAGNVSDAFHCSNKGGFSIGPYTVPGLSPGGQGGANCSNPPSSLPIPVSWIGVYRSEASLSRTYTCVPTYLNAEFTARVRYTIEVEVSGAQLLEYVKACEAAGIDVDDALAFIATRVPAAERRAELASRVRAAQHELDLVPDEAIPPAAAQEVKKAVTDLKKEEGWMTVEEDKTFSPGSYAPDLDGCASALRAAEAAIDSSTGK
jgi:hypothetical protein